MTFRDVGVKVKGLGCSTLMKWTNIFKTVNILYTDIHKSILGIDLKYAPDDLSRCWGQGQRSRMLYINEMDKYLQNG
jgi:hypothetical protein